jgi:hypothetical protein
LLEHRLFANGMTIKSRDNFYRGKKMKKLILIISFLIFIMFISICNSTLIDNYDNYSASDYVGLYSTNWLSGGQIFNVTGNYNITQSSFKLSRQNNPNCNIIARLYNLSDKKIIGSLLEESDKFNSTLLTTTLTYYTFNFSGTVNLLDSHYYWISVFIVDIVLASSTNYVRVARDTRVYTHENRYSYYYYSGYYGSATNQDILFYVYGNETSIPTPTPIGKYTETDLENNFILGGIFVFIISSLIILILITEKKRKK